MKNKNGFVSMTLVYTFLIVFLFLMLAIVSSYANKNKFMDAINKQIDRDINENRTIISTITNKMLADNSVEEDTGIKYYNIANNGKGNGNGLFYTDDESKTDENGDGITSRIYFYRGEVNNNYLILNNLCFRIIRTTEDGNVRIRYDGLSYNNTCRARNDSEYNPSIGSFRYKDMGNSEEYVGFMYDRIDEEDVYPETNIKHALEEWFYTYIGSTTSYEYVTDGIFCNDRSLFAEEGNVKFFGARNFSPVVGAEKITINQTFKCTNKKDRFNLATLSGGLDEHGNNQLTYPVGLITISDIVYAGGYLILPNDTYLGGSDGTINASYYLNTGKSYWTMSPLYFNANTESIENYYDGANMVIINEDGEAVDGKVNSSYEVIPVINIKGSSKVKSGLGTLDKPYIIGR